MDSNFITEGMLENEIDAFLQKHAGYGIDEVVGMNSEEKEEALSEFVLENDSDIAEIYDAYIAEHTTEEISEEPITLLDIYDWKEDQEDEGMMFPNGKDDE